MLRVEFHCHTIYSKDSLTAPQKLVQACRRKGLDRVVVTDHNTIRGAQAAHLFDPDLVIVGEEVMTEDGELLAAFVKEEVPPNLPALEAIARLREQGAFISVSHPFDEFRHGHWKPHALERIAPLVDAIEIFNARCMRDGHNHLAQSFAGAYQLLGTCGSDAHTTFELGRATMLLPEFSDPTELKNALRSVQYKNRLSSPWVHFTSRFAVWVKRMKVGT